MKLHPGKSGGAVYPGSGVVGERGGGAWSQHGVPRLPRRPAALSLTRRLKAAEAGAAMGEGGAAITI